MRWDSLETSFFELVSILSFLNKKKGVFSLLDSNWIKLWFFPFRLFALAEMFEPTFGLGRTISLSLMDPSEIFKKKKSKKKKTFQIPFFWIQIGENFGSFHFVQWLAEMFEPTFGLGGAISLSLMDPSEIFQKKKKRKKLKKKTFQISLFWIQIRETLVLSFSFVCARRNV